MLKKYFDLKLLICAIVSALIHSIAITSFSIPAGLYPGGFSGISRITSDIILKFFNTSISYSVLYLTLNAIAAIIVYKRIGRKFTIYSILQFLLVSFFTSVLKPLVQLDNILLYAIFGGLVQGFAVGLALSFDFSTGGFDFLSVYYSNKYKKSLWNYTFSINAVVLLTAGLLFGIDKALYSVIFQFCSTQVIKSLHKRYTYTTLTIITSSPKEVANEIQRNVRHGITEIHTKGHFSNTDNTMLYMVVNTYQYRDIVDIVLSVDEHAFINVQKTLEIHGNYYQKPLD